MTGQCRCLADAEAIRQTAAMYLTEGYDCINYAHITPWWQWWERASLKKAAEEWFDDARKLNTQALILEQEHEKHLRQENARRWL